MIPVGVAFVMKCFSQAHLWLIVISSIIALVVLFTLWVIVVWMIFGAKKPIEKLKRKTKEERTKEKLDEIVRRNFPERFEKLSNSILQIDIINPLGRDILTGKNTYRLKVKNIHPSKAVKNLKVWLCDIEWPKSAQKPLIWNGIIFPFLLPEKGSKNNDFSYEIPAGLEKEFDIMFVKLDSYKRTINLAPFKPMKDIAPSLIGSFYSDTSFSIEILPRDESKITFHFKISGGDGDMPTIAESCVLKIPVLLPENSLENQVANINSMIREFDNYLPKFEKPIKKEDSNLQFDT
jgi:hypothetical protein